jgi:hypothetical protein
VRVTPLLNVHRTEEELRIKTVSNSVSYQGVTRANLLMTERSMEVTRKVSDSMFLVPLLKLPYPRWLSVVVS